MKSFESLQNCTICLSKESRFCALSQNIVRILNYSYWGLCTLCVPRKMDYKVFYQEIYNVVYLRMMTSSRNNMAPIIIIVHLLQRTKIKLKWGNVYWKPIYFCYLPYLSCLTLSIIESRLSEMAHEIESSCYFLLDYK